MYIRFVLDPFVPHGINKVIRRVIKDLRNIFPDLAYSVEVDDTLPEMYSGEDLPSNKIFQRKSNMACRGIVFYVLSAKISWYRKPVFGLSRPSKCMIGLGYIPKVEYIEWSSKTWELILHELGHSFGLIQKGRKKSFSGFSGIVHCSNDCVMSEDTMDSFWSKRARDRYIRLSPYCNECLSYLKAKSV